MDDLAYIEETAKNPESRNMQRMFDMMDTRYGETDTEKSRTWATQFAEFKRNGRGGGDIETFGRVSRALSPS